MKKRHQLRLVGITYNQIDSGVYAVILEELNGGRRIPIVIGYNEAQAIECHLQKVRTPRPLTHDLLKTILDTFGLRLSCIDIHKLPSGVFAADLVMENSEGELHKTDARSSDAIAIAVRTGSPIYTTSEVLDECGFYPAKGKPGVEAGKTPQEDKKDDMPAEELLMQAIGSKHNDLESFAGIEEFIVKTELDPEDADAEILDFLSNYSDKEVEAQISSFAALEKYEVAARLKSLLKKRKNQS